MTDEEIQRKIEIIIEDMRPNFQMDGGDIIFKSFENGIVAICLEGSCASSAITCSALQEEIRERLLEEVSDVHEVIAIKE